MPEKGLKDIWDFLQEKKEILIASHRNPDGDALGSSLAMWHYLKRKGHRVSVAVPSPYPDDFQWMEGIDEVMIFDEDEKQVTEKIKNADLFIFLDFNHISRIDKMGEEIEKQEKPVLLIDHHLDPDLSYPYYYVKPGASSTADLVFDVLTWWEGTSYIEDPVITTCLYTGIITDTGTFAYNTSSHLFEKLTRMLRSSIDHIALQNRINHNMTEKQLKLLGYCLYHRMEVLPELQTGIIFLTKNDYSKFDIQRGDTEGIVNHILKMKNIEVAAFFTQQPTIVKISFRSVGDFNVAALAEEHFNGGGHKNAAGGSHFKGLKSAIQLFKEILPEFINKHKQTNE